jgi:hypothetical protein
MLHDQEPLSEIRSNRTNSSYAQHIFKMGRCYNPLEGPVEKFKQNK